MPLTSPDLVEVNSLQGLPQEVKSLLTISLEHLAFPLQLSIAAGVILNS